MNIELTERAEVPVVNKEARVVEEIRVSKDVTERNETVRDTVRNTEIDITGIIIRKEGMIPRPTDFNSIIFFSPIAATVAAIGLLSIITNKKRVFFPLCISFKELIFTSVFHRILDFKRG